MGALATADQVHRLLRGTDAHTELHFVTDLEVMKAKASMRPSAAWSAPFCAFLRPAS